MTEVRRCAVCSPHRALAHPLRFPWSRSLAYTLFRTDEWDRIHIRQFLVIPTARRQRVGTEALALFRRDLVPPGRQLILEVLTHNRAARAFYAACGFREYAVTLLADPINS